MTGSLDRSIRVHLLPHQNILWLARTDLFVRCIRLTTIQLPACNSILGESSLPRKKVYDKDDGRHWDCGSAEQLEDGKARSLMDILSREGVSMGAC